MSRAPKLLNEEKTPMRGRAASLAARDKASRYARAYGRTNEVHARDLLLDRSGDDRSERRKGLLRRPARLVLRRHADGRPGRRLLDGADRRRERGRDRAH